MFAIFKSIFVLFVMLSIVGGSTYAVFSAHDSISGNKISTAQLHFRAEGVAGESSLSKPIDAEGLMPGMYTEWARAALHNESVVPVHVFFFVENLSGSACPFLNLVLATGTSGSDLGEQSQVMYSGSIGDISGSSNRVEISGNSVWEKLEGNTTQHIQQRAQLDVTADNNAQGESCTWDEVFVAETILPSE